MADPVKQTEKELTIKLRHSHLNTGGYILLVIALITIIIAQQYVVIDTNGVDKTTGDSIVEEKNNLKEEVTDTVVDKVVEQVENVAEVVAPEEVVEESE